MKHPSVDDIAFIVDTVNEFMNYDEPVVVPQPHRLGRLEACLAQPFQSYDGTDHYPDAAMKAAVLFYLIIKNHPLPNGNKRVAVVSTVLFLLDNGIWLNTTPDTMYKMATRVAMTDATHKDEVLKILKEAFEASFMSPQEFEATFEDAA